MTHILKQYHPEYWDGSIKNTQSFLCRSLSITQIETDIKAVLQANREKLAELRANAKMFQLPKTNGRVVGLNRG